MATASHHLIEIYPANKMQNQTEIVPSYSFNFFYKLYYKSGKKKSFLFILHFTILVHLSSEDIN